MIKGSFPLSGLRKILLILILSISVPLYAQDAVKYYKIELTDGTVFIGTIVSQDANEVVMKTAALPEVRIPSIKIKTTEEIDASRIKNGVYWFPNPHATRYFFGPSAFNLKKNEGYYQNAYIIFNSFNYGLTDHLSVGGGLEFISTFSSLNDKKFDPLFFLTPKVSYKVSEKFHAGGGVLFANTPSAMEGNRSSLGIAYGIGTFGTEDKNITAGMGWGFVEGEFSSRPIFTISGMSRISKRTALVTENWFIPSDSYVGLVSYGVRFFGEKMAVDVGFITNGDISEFLFPGIPYIDFVVKF